VQRFAIRENAFVGQFQLEALAGGVDARLDGEFAGLVVSPQVVSARLGLCSFFFCSS
jgi:hypothetical protein